MGPQEVCSRSPKVGNPIASILKSNVEGIPALFGLTPVSNFVGFTVKGLRIHGRLQSSSFECLSSVGCDVAAVGFQGFGYVRVSKCRFVTGSRGATRFRFLPPILLRGLSEHKARDSKSPSKHRNLKTANRIKGLGFGLGHSMIALCCLHGDEVSRW